VLGVSLVRARGRDHLHSYGPWLGVAGLFLATCASGPETGPTVPAVAPYDGSEFKVIHYPGASETIASAINSRGDIVGRYDTSDGRTHGFFLRDGRFESIDLPGADFTMVRGVNDRGDMVGASRQPGRRNSAYVLRDGKVAPLAVPGARVSLAFQINTNGDVVDHTSTPTMSLTASCSRKESTSRLTILEPRSRTRRASMTREKWSVAGTRPTAANTAFTGLEVSSPRWIFPARRSLSPTRSTPTATLSASARSETEKATAFCAAVACSSGSAIREPSAPWRGESTLEGRSSDDLNWRTGRAMVTCWNGGARQPAGAPAG